MKTCYRFLCFTFLSLSFLSQRTSAQAWQHLGPSIEDINWTSNAYAYYDFALVEGVPHVIAGSLNKDHGIVVKKYNGLKWELVGNPLYPQPKALTTQFFVKSLTGNKNSLLIAHSEPDMAGNTTVRKLQGTTWQPVGTRGFLKDSLTAVDVAINQANEPYVAAVTYSKSKKYALEVYTYTQNAWTRVGGKLDSTDIDQVYMHITADNNVYVSYDRYGTAVFKLVDGTWKKIYNGFSSSFPSTFTNSLGQIVSDNQNNLYLLEPSEGYEYTNGKTIRTKNLGLKKYNGTSWLAFGPPVHKVIDSLNRFRGYIGTGLTIGKNRQPIVTYSYENAPGTLVKRLNGTVWEQLQDTLLPKLGTPESAYMQSDTLRNRTYLLSPDVFGPASLKMYDGSWFQVLGSRSGIAKGTSSPNTDFKGVVVKGVPHLLLRDSYYGGLVVKKWENNTWKTVGKEAFNVQPLGVGLDMAADHKGRLYVCYPNYATKKFFYIHQFDGKEWLKLKDSISFTYGNEPYLAFDQQDSLYVAYEDWDDQVHVFKYSQNKFKPLDMGGLSNVDWYPSLAIGKDNKPYLLVSDLTNKARAKVKRYTNGKWEDVGGYLTGKMATQGYLSHDTEGNVYAALVDSIDTHSLFVKKWDGTQWSQVGPTTYLTNVGQEWIDQSSRRYTVPSAYLHSFVVSSPQQFTLTISEITDTHYDFLHVKHYNGQSWVDMELPSAPSLDIYRAKAFSDANTLYLTYNVFSAQFVAQTSFTVTDVKTESSANVPLFTTIYPNPNQGSFQVATSNVHEVTLTDVMGTTEYHSVRVIQTQLKGLVLVKVTTDEGVATYKVIVE